MSNRAFRSVTAKQAKDKVYRITGLNVTAAPTASAFSSGISASAPYIAIAAPTKGGIIPLTTAFEKFNRNENQPLVNAHPGNDITDFVFSPHNDFVLATSCATSVRVFKLPPTISKNISTPNVEITGLNSVLSLKWHPTVRGLLAIACKDSLIIALVDFDGFETESTPEDYAEATETASGRPIFKCMVEGFGADICTMTWSADGSKIATVSKNGNLFVLDPRTHPFDQPLKPISLDDMKNPMAVEFTGSVAQKTEQVLVIGLGRARKPIYRFFDVETLQVTSQGDIPVSPGQLCTAYDKDTGLLAVLSRGGQSLCMFELSATRDVTGKLTQTFFGLSQIILASNSKGIMFASKHNLAVLDMEVGRLLSHNGEGIELYSLNVVRKERLFYPELFPPTASQKATNNFDDWVDGKNVDVELISLDPGYGVTIDATKMDNVNNSMSGMSISSPSSASSVSSPSNVSTAIAPTPVAAPTITQVLASAESSYNSSARKQLDNKLQRTIYQHTTGIEPGTNKETFTYQLRPASTLLPLGRSLVANDKFWALPWSAAGSFTIYVRHQETIGRVPNNVTGIRGTCRTLHTYDISTLEQHKIATVGDDGIVKVYTLPNVDTWKPHTELPADIHDATWEFPILPPGEGKTGIMKFSPYVEGVLVAAAFNPMSGQDEVHLLCVKDGSEGDNLAQSYNGLLRDRAIDLDFSPDGSTVAITGRDNIVSIISMPSGRLLHTIAPPQRTKELQVRFVDKDHILTIGYTRGSDRSVSLIKLSDIGSSSLDSPASPTPLKNVSVVNTSPMIPYYDIAANLLIIGNLGAASYNIFRVSVTEQPYIDTLSVFGSKSDILGSAFIHKSFVNVREVEVLRSIKFSKSGEIWPVSWRVPRKRKEFFQDDIYESGCAKFSSLCTADEFFSGSYERQVLGNVAKPIEFISLRPADMINLSEAPDEELTTRQLKYHQMKQQAAEEVTVTGCLGHKTNEETLDYFRQKASTSAVTSGRFDARTTEVLDDVSDSEWD